MTRLDWTSWITGGLAASALLLSTGCNPKPNGGGAAAGNPQLAFKMELFSKNVKPILEESCVSCHGPEKQKGKLRLDSFEAIRAGGEQGPVVIPGDPKNSSLHWMTALPEDDADVMPQKGDRLTSAQQDHLKLWILEGAYFPDGSTAGQAAAGSGLPDFSFDTDFANLPMPDPLLISQLKEKGVLFRSLNKAGTYLDVDFSHSEMVHGSGGLTLGVIANLAVNIGYLDLARTKITDADLAVLTQCKNMTRLHLERTAISDAGLVHLKKAKKLEYLNLYETKVTDAGLAHLKKCVSLRNLYVWNTKVTPNGVATLKASVPDVDVVLDVF